MSERIGCDPTRVSSNRGHRDEFLWICNRVGEAWPEVMTPFWLHVVGRAEKHEVCVDDRFNGGVGW